MNYSYTLGEIVEVELAGNWIKGKVIYLEKIGSLSTDFEWMKKSRFKRNVHPVVRQRICFFITLN